jgi:hypothetical protein
MTWKSYPTKLGALYVGSFNYTSRVVAQNNGIIALILRLGRNSYQRIVYDDLNDALDDAERHARQAA